MKPVLDSERRLLEFESLPSTQELLSERIRTGDRSVGVVLAFEQTAGRARRGRSWYSPAGGSLSLSLALFDYAGWSRPELLGMAVGLAAARALDCLVAWPNDLVLGDPLAAERGTLSGDGVRTAWGKRGLRKIGGVLTEMIAGCDGREVPVVGIGANLCVRSFPHELKGIATSFTLEGRAAPSPREACDRILKEIEALPEPHSWSVLASGWAERDATPGKRYRLPDGRVATGVAINAAGWLIADAGGDVVTVPSAEGLFPP
ncbi:MAG: biotin--[acetyl-CoA-carboxylase] ligase [Armatimonadetes bacterium]|nr:biotin--[acetyl-CoA-carboxylase] ligase [Armatimonadota bacterium]